MSRVSIAFAVLIACAPTCVAAQGLADVAKAEEARRKTVEKTAAKTTKVYTNSDLKPDNTLPSSANATPSAPTDPAAPGATPADGSKTPAGEQTPPPPLRDQAYWSARIGEARTALGRSRILAQALQSRINALTTDFTNRDDPAQRSVIERDRIQALDEVKRVQKEMEDQAKAITAIEEEARRAGVPAGWLR